MPCKGEKMKQSPLTTVIEIVEEQYSDSMIDPPESLASCLGAIELQLHGLREELLKRESDQDAEAIFQHLILISGAAMSAASVHVLPFIQKEGR